MSKERQYITILFSCKECKKVDVEAKVRAREKHEDINWWMRRVVGDALHYAHQLVSFGCECCDFRNLKIPLGDKDDPDPWIGKYTTMKAPEGLPEDAQLIGGGDVADIDKQLKEDCEKWQSGT